MRKPTLLHKPPTTLPAPADLTLDHLLVHAQASLFGVLPIHEQAAREIIAAYAFAGSTFEAFASSGYIDDDLVDHITGQIVASKNTPSCDMILLFLARNYVLGCTVSTYAVGHNEPGYLPESDVFRTMSLSSAKEVLTSDLLEAPELLFGECDCLAGDESDDLEMCESCVCDAHMRAILNGDGPPDGIVNEWSQTINGPGATLMSYWIMREEMTVEAFLAERVK